MIDQSIKPISQFRNLTVYCTRTCMVIWVNEKYLCICGLHTCEGRVAQFVRNHGITAPKYMGLILYKFLGWGLFTAPL